MPTRAAVRQIRPCTGFVLKGTVADWRDVSFHADRICRHPIADRLWVVMENRRKEELRCVRVGDECAVEFIMSLVEAFDLGIIEIPP